MIESSSSISGSEINKRRPSHDAVLSGKLKQKEMEAGRANYQLFTNNNNRGKTVTIDILGMLSEVPRSKLDFLIFIDGAKYMSRAVSHQTEIPLEARQRLAERRNLLPSREFIPEPCFFPALRWAFSLLAAGVLIFVMMVFLYMLYEVMRRENSSLSTSTDSTVSL